MKKLLFVVVLLLALSLSANAATHVFGCRIAGDKDSTVDFAPGFSASPNAAAVASSGAVCTAPGAIDSWGLYVSSNQPIVGVRSATYSNALPVAGYYEVSAAWATNTNGKVDAKHVVTSAGGATNTALLNQATADNKNKWMTMGVYKYNANDAANTKVTLTNDNQSTSGSLYLHSIRYVSATPGAVTYNGPANGATGEAMDFVDLGLSWTAGLYNMAFDVWFGDDSNNMTKIMSAFTDTALGLDPGEIQAGKTYFWRVDALNVDNVTQGETWSFTTNPIPEPGSMLALASGLVGLFGIIRRKRA
ncbi:MAG: PEP-CTERM sorting domain-containing protein [Armatimonadetes bacterium]|nr:PEP-CTERM sorting domain-containing protein [Armatimonadota bacterium]